MNFPKSPHLKSDFSEVTRPTREFHVLAKPAGPICNLDCAYCFYLEKEKLLPNNRGWRMNDEVLEAYVCSYIAAQPGEEVSFAFQGGEPTLMGIDWFRKVVALQKIHAGDKRIENSIQTNGTLLDDSWGEFLAGEGFLVGLSLDGPEALHDALRPDKKGGGSFHKVMRGLDILRRHRVEFNLLACVNSVTVREPLAVYDFLTGLGTPFVQFIPIVEREGLHDGLAGPPDLLHPPGADEELRMTEWSVPAGAYGEFLCAVFDRWMAQDVGKVFVQIFESTLRKWVGLPAGICVFEETCGSALAMEHNGDVYACDHYVYPEFKLGNLMDTPLGDLAGGRKAWEFGEAKRDTLPKYCRECEVRFVCNGECPKHRFTRTPDGEWGLNFLCPAYKRFFNHVAPAMEVMADLLERRRPVEEVMEWWKSATSAKDRFRQR